MIAEPQIGKSREIAVGEVDSRVPLSDEALTGQQIALPPLKRVSDASQVWEKASIISSRRGAVLSQTSVKNEYAYFRDQLELYPDSIALKVKLAALAILTGEHAEAIAHLSDAASETNRPWIRQRLAEAKLYAGRESDATKIFSELASTGYAASMLRIAEGHLSDRNLQAAQDIAKQARVAEPLNWRAHLFEGAVSLLSGNPVQAIRSLRAALELNERLPNAYTWLAFAHHLIQDDRHAIKDLKKALALNPSNETALLALADIGADLPEATTTAEPYLKFYVNENPENVAAAERLARICELSGRPGEGVHYLKSCPNLNRHPGLLNNLGVLLRKKGDKKGGIEAFYKALSLDRNVAPSGYDAALVNLLRILLRRGMAREALQLANEYISARATHLIAAEDPAYKVVILRLLGLFALGREEDALSAGEELLGDSSSCIAARIEAGCIMGSHWAIDRSDPERALGYTNRAYLLAAENTRKLPNNILRWALNGYVFALLESGDVVTAGKYINRLERLGPDDASIATRGLYSIKQGRIKEGERLYRQAARMQDRVENKRLFLQKMYLELGKAERENREYKRAERLLRKAVSFKKVGFPIPIKGIRARALQELKDLERS